MIILKVRQSSYSKPLEKEVEKCKKLLQIICGTNFDVQHLSLEGVNGVASCCFISK